MSMHVWATKDLHEREDDEAERLVRPAPKVKPPRHDRRREETQADRDPDIDTDKDTKRDPDLSLNRKNVGGSDFVYPFVVYRVAGRFLRADIDRSSGEWVSVVNTETGHHSRIKKETLKGPEGAKYKVVDKGEEGATQEQPQVEKPQTPAPAEQKKPEGKPGPSGEAVAQLRELAESNPQVKGMIEILSNPKHKEYTTLTSLPNIPLASVLKDVKMPEGLATIGDFHKAVSQMPKKAPEPKKPAEGAPTGEAKPPKEKKPVDPDELTKAITEQLPKVIADQVSKALEQAFAKYFPQGGPAKKDEEKPGDPAPAKPPEAKEGDRKSTRLNS